MPGNWWHHARQRVEPPGRGAGQWRDAIQGLGHAQRVGPPSPACPIPGGARARRWRAPEASLGRPGCAERAFLATLTLHLSTRKLPPELPPNTKGRHRTRRYATAVVSAEKPTKSERSETPKDGPIWLCSDFKTGALNHSATHPSEQQLQHPGTNRELSQNCHRIVTGARISPTLPGRQCRLDRSDGRTVGCPQLGHSSHGSNIGVRPCPPTDILYERKVADAGAVRQRRPVSTFNPRVKPCRRSPNLASSGAPYSMRGVASCDIQECADLRCSGLWP